MKQISTELITYISGDCTLLVVSESPRTKLGSKATPKRGPRLIELLRVEVVSDMVSLSLSKDPSGVFKFNIWREIYDPFLKLLFWIF